MIKKIKMEVEVEEIDSIICDKCGKKYEVEENWEEIQEFLHINFTGGCGSIFGDGSNVQCDICQYCLKDMIKDFMRTKVAY